MKTNFFTLEVEETEKKEPKKKKTVFTHYINAYKEIKKPSTMATDFENVLLIGRDKYYGDVFKVWDNDPNDFAIYFGEAGDEFEK